ncbi:hypothetical protein FRB91_010820 [Serendipita sp. 411]|nr:hypothetical protein FRB91_010820 [Serendipita sp. 411]
MPILNASDSLDLIKETMTYLFKSKLTRKKASRATANTARQRQDHRDQGEGFSFIRQLSTNGRAIMRIT